MSNSKTKEVGRRYGLLVVLADAEPHRFYAEYEKRFKSTRRVLVKCDCGSEKVVNLPPLRDGRTTSCGCVRVRMMKARTGENNPSRSHGRSGTRIYHSWRSMIGRCNNPNASNYSLYGGRGIVVCPSWHQFENFLADMGERPEGTTLDRIDNNGNYEPSNCRWASAAEQRMNQGSRKPKLNPDGVRQIRVSHAAGATHQSLADEWGVCRQTISDLLTGRTWQHVP